MNVGKLSLTVGYTSCAFSSSEVQQRGSLKIEGNVLKARARAEISERKRRWLVGRITRTCPFSILQITEWKKAKSSQCCHEDMSEEIFFLRNCRAFCVQPLYNFLRKSLSPSPTVSALCRHLPETNGLTRRPNSTQPTDFSFQETPSSRPVGWGPAGNRPHEKQLIPARAWEKKEEEDERPLFPLQQKEVGRQKMEEEEEEETKETKLTRRTLAGSKGDGPEREGL